MKLGYNTKAIDSRFRQLKNIKRRKPLKIKEYCAFLSAVKMLYPKLILKFFTTFFIKVFR